MGDLNAQGHTGKPKPMRDLASKASSIPDPVGLGLTTALGLHSQWTIWHGQCLLGAAVSTALTTCIRIPDQFKDHTPCLTYKVF
ncbi:unnamed protein product [Echinostoma caproni]|uniref:Uncharacterized protein n=1 Tax=Echinostoma caproni TaxID=27848 RepID=A0A183AXI1_9TREM|nr:unnamed protein product [Echinostoma caproni]